MGHHHRRGKRSSCPDVTVDSGLSGTSSDAPGGGAPGVAGYARSLGEIAAVKLVPLGQAAGQRVLHKLTTRLPALVTQALATGDEALGASATTLAIASACHESQYTRLYRS